MPNNVVKNEFDLKASQYESNRLANWYKAHAQEISKHCPTFGKGDILDIGCASGYQLRLLSQTHPESRLVGLDLSAKMINQAEMAVPAAAGKFHFLSDDWENLNTESRSFLKQFDFKLIICANTFHYFKNPQNAISQMYEMLDTDGMLLILEREKSSSPLTLLWGFIHRHFIKDQVEFYAADTVSHYLSQTGFSNVQIVSTIKKYFWKGKLFTSIAIIKGNK